ncbi:MAG: DUF4097 family beta strand repeat protein [Candidatus Eisenbacteria bacterium]|uniref:DUF4097 family beta strand repeat protein n=1 Tax=Eiseniibacteriota bacterium TaxID=2212470 RepID=A0A933SBB9_UNCEI|nr:DUF4097 family beta strand repeat protein [Candidatus Eisenbacteria bacterium]
MRFATLAAALLATATLAATDASARVWEKTWKVGAEPAVHVNTNDGDIRVVRAADGTVHTRIEYKVRVWGWHSEPREPLIELNQNGDDIRITCRERGNVVVFGGMTEEFTILVEVPAACDLDIRSGDGDVDIAPGQGVLAAHTGDGHIRIEGHRGTLELSSGDGAVDAENVDGSLSATTGDGRVRVSGRFDKLVLRSGDGSLNVSAHRGSKLAEPWDVASGDGPVTVRIPRDLSALLDASTRDGSLHVDLPVDVSGGMTHHTLRGELNGGKTPLRLRTGDGRLTLALSE